MGHFFPPRNLGPQVYIALRASTFQHISSANDPFVIVIPQIKIHLIKERQQRKRTCYNITEAKNRMYT